MNTIISTLNKKERNVILSHIAFSLNIFIRILLEFKIKIKYLQEIYLDGFCARAHTHTHTHTKKKNFLYFL